MEVFFSELNELFWNPRSILAVLLTTFIALPILVHDSLAWASAGRHTNRLWSLVKKWIILIKMFFCGSALSSSRALARLNLYRFPEPFSLSLYRHPTPPHRWSTRLLAPCWIFIRSFFIYTPTTRGLSTWLETDLIYTLPRPVALLPIPILLNGGSDFKPFTKPGEKN